MFHKKKKKNKAGKKEPCNGVALISNAPRKMDSYEVPAKSLMLAIESEDENYNIGIIGSFGSGKSSLLKTYKDLNNNLPKTKKRKIVSVSLASFFNNNNRINQTNEENERYLESIIIQQILYSVSRWRLPSSRINRIGFRLRTILLFLSAVICTLCFVVYNNLSLFGLCEIMSVKRCLLYSGIAFSIVTFVLLFLCYPINSIVAKIKNVEIKSEPNIKSTLFDEYLDELLYFFHKTRTSVVIFEDIDRCHIDDIFNRLRTLNITLNNNKWFYNKKKKIHFVYAVKEDLFISSETKSKFFDVLISLPALLSQDNVLSHIRMVLKNHDINTLDDTFLSHIATFIISYRQINNITNDYILMSKTKYSKTGIDNYTAKRLFAVLAYKSIFPYDYLQFLKNDGYLYHFIKKNDAMITELDKKYKETCPEEVPSDEIKKFYKLLSNYFDTASLALISNFVEGDYENDEQKLFYDRLKANPDFYDVDVVYSDPFCILDHQYAMQYYNSNSFLNISIIENAFKKKKKYKTFLSNFSKWFANSSNNKKAFVEKVGSLVEKNPAFVFSFFELIVSVYPPLTSELKSYNFFKTTMIIKRYLKQVIKTKANATFQNVASLFAGLLESNYDADVILCELKDELREQLLSLDYKIKSIHIVSYYKNSTFNYKNSLFELIANNRISLTLENYKRIGDVIEDRFGFQAPPIASIAYGSSVDKRLNVIAKELNTFITDGLYPDKEFGDYKSCSNEVIIASLKLFKKKELQEQIINTCNPIECMEGDIFDINTIEKMVLKHKITAPISVWNTLSNLSPTIKEFFLRDVIDNHELILRNENIKSSNYHNLLYSILNDNKCNYSLAGKIMELTCDSNSISMASLSNIEAIRCAIDYKYIHFEEQDLNIVPLEYISLYLKKYEDVINLIPVIVGVETKRIKYLLENSEKDSQSFIIRKMVPAISEANTFIQGYTEVICADITNFSAEFIKSFVVSPILINEKRVAVLLASYLQTRDLKDILEILKSQKVEFKRSDSFINFNNYLHNHKEFGYTFQYSKKKDCYFLRRL